MKKNAFKKIGMCLLAAAVIAGCSMFSSLKKTADPAAKKDKKHQQVASQDSTLETTPPNTTSVTPAPGTNTNHTLIVTPAGQDPDTTTPAPVIHGHAHG